MEVAAGLEASLADDQHAHGERQKSEGEAAQHEWCAGDDDRPPIPAKASRRRGRGTGGYLAAGHCGESGRDGGLHEENDDDAGDAPGPDGEQRRDRADQGRDETDARDIAHAAEALEDGDLQPGQERQGNGGTENGDLDGVGIGAERPDGDRVGGQPEQRDRGEPMDSRDGEQGAADAADLGVVPPGQRQSPGGADIGTDGRQRGARARDAGERAEHRQTGRADHQCEQLHTQHGHEHVDRRRGAEDER